MKKRKNKPNTDVVSLLLRNLRTIKKYLALHFHLSALREIDFLLFVKSYSRSGYSVTENRSFLNSDFKKTDDLFIELYGKGFIEKDPKNKKYYVCDKFNKMAETLLSWGLEEGIEMALHTRNMKPTFKEADDRRNNYKRNFKYLNDRNKKSPN